MTKEFNSLEEIQKYYDGETNTYFFKEDDKYIDVVFNFSLDVEANIRAFDINAQNIIAKNIIGWNIKAINITAQDISYYAVCYAYENIKCKSIKGMRHKIKLGVHLEAYQVIIVKNMKLLRKT